MNINHVIPSVVEGPGGMGGTPVCGSIIAPSARPDPSTEFTLSEAEGLGMTRKP